MASLIPVISRILPAPSTSVVHSQLLHQPHLFRSRLCLFLWRIPHLEKRTNIGRRVRVFVAVMAMLKKVWGSVYNWSSSRSNSTYPMSSSSSSVLSSMGAFDPIPTDILIQILRFLEPKDTIKLSLTCKCWKLLVSDNRLWIFFLQNQKEPWESIFFAETTLRSGYPFQ